MREFISRYSQRGLVIVISDFLDDQGCERALQFLSDFGHELMLLQIWSEEDRTPPWDGELELEDAETGGHLKVQFDQSARARYTQAFDEYAAAIQKLALAQQRPLCRSLHVRSRWRKSYSGRWSRSRGSSLNVPLLNLTLGQFLAVFGSVSAVMLALYLLDRSRRRQVVSTLRFWVSAEQPTVVARRRRIQQPWSLLLQLASMALLLLAIAQLRLGAPASAPRDHVLILDTSAWMARAHFRPYLDGSRPRPRPRLRPRRAGRAIASCWCAPMPSPLPLRPSNPTARRSNQAIAASRPGATALNLDQALAFCPPDSGGKRTPRRRSRFRRYGQVGGNRSRPQTPPIPFQSCVFCVCPMPLKTVASGASGYAAPPPMPTCGKFTLPCAITASRRVP